MRKITAWIKIFVLIAFLVSLPSCATDKPFVKKDLMSLSPIKVARTETPTFIKDTPGRRMGGFCLLGGLGGQMMLTAGGKTMVEQFSLPDFGELVRKKFIKNAKKKIRNWPPIIIEKQPVSKDYIYQLGTLLVFRVKIWGVSYVGIGAPQGFLSTTNAKLIESGGNLLWEKTFTYKSKEFNRNRKLEEFEIDNGKLLKEEIEFAAEKTVSDFIEHFERGK